MNQFEITTLIRVYANADELDAPLKRLVNEAEKAMKTAYAPYSNFHVGAALLLEDGSIVSGSNQENASFSVGLCAERVALAAKAASFPEKKIQAIAVAVKQGDDHSPVSPCGVCRQALMEAEVLQQQPLKILMTGASGVVYETGSVKQLLPLAFTSEKLRGKQ